VIDSLKEDIEKKIEFIADQIETISILKSEK